MYTSVAMVTVKAKMKKMMMPEPKVRMALIPQVQLKKKLQDKLNLLSIQWPKLLIMQN